jgi:hypothetical protein
MHNQAKNLKLAACLMTVFIAGSGFASAAPVAAGADRDGHGCIGSAGYTWSLLKSKCIRVFEEGVRLDPVLQPSDAAISAFILFRSKTDFRKAELFLPDRGTGLILNRKGGARNGIWAGSGYQLSFIKGQYKLANTAGKALYREAASKSK